jgi:hypothetical protein
LQWSVQNAPQNTQQELLQTYETAVPEPEALSRTFDLRQMAAREGSGVPPLEVGETLRLQATALDSRPPALGGAQQAVSNLLTFRIVTADELLAKAIETQRALREQIDRVIEMQIDAQRRCETAVGHARQTTTLALGLRETAAAADTQQQIEDLLSGVIGRLETLLEQLRNNRAVSGEDETALRASVIGPLKAAKADLVGPLVRKLDGAKSLGSAAELTAELNAVIASQEQVVQALRAVVKEMFKVENAQHLEGNLRTLIKAGDEVRALLKGKQPAEAPPKPPEGKSPGPKRSGEKESKP